MTTLLSASNFNLLGSLHNLSGALRLFVLTVVLPFGLYRYIQKRREYEADKAFGDQHGCLPMETILPYKWPFALDVLKRQYDALPAQRLLAFQSQYLDKMGPNMELKLFGVSGYITTDPQNVEALLSTRFEGIDPWWPSFNTGALFGL